MFQELSDVTGVGALSRETRPPRGQPVQACRFQHCRLHQEFLAQVYFEACDQHSQYAWR